MALEPFVYKQVVLTSQRTVNVIMRLNALTASRVQSVLSNRSINTGFLIRTYLMQFITGLNLVILLNPLIWWQHLFFFSYKDDSFGMIISKSLGYGDS